MSKFFEFNQNNTGGSFEVNDKLCHRLFIEADNYEEANSIAERLGCYWDGVYGGMDCDCCGDRWYPNSEGDGIDLGKISDSYKIIFSTIEIYAQYLADKYGWTNPDCRIFYKDGRIIEIKKATN
jgi:hypothetical protein